MKLIVRTLRLQRNDHKKRSGELLDLILFGYSIRRSEAEVDACLQEATGRMPSFADI